MSDAIQTLWKRLKIAAFECAERGECLTESQAEALVVQTARSVPLWEALPAEAIEFFALEVLSVIDGYEDRSAAG